MARNFALTGVAGFVAPRHLAAIHETGNRLIAAMDPHDSVGVLDQYFPDCAFFTEFERFDRHLEKLRRGPEESRVDFLSVCSPNHLHDAHVRLALRIGADAICEKPLVLFPRNLDALALLEEESGRKVTTVLQLRLHPAIVALRDAIGAQTERRHKVRLHYVTSRGTWYRYSWKGDPARSGGIAANIGVHFFDMLLWVFGPVQASRLLVSDDRRMGGELELALADVEWFLSIDRKDLPAGLPEGQTTFRSITVDEREVEFSVGFRDLHRAVYQEVLAGRGFTIEDARPAIELVHAIRHTEPSRKGT